MTDLATVDPLDCDPRDHEDRDHPEPDVSRCTWCRRAIELDTAIELPDGTLVHRDCEPEYLLEHVDEPLLCLVCDKPAHDSDSTDPCGSGELVHNDCLEDWNISRAERAAEHDFERANEGSAPFGIEEHHQIASAWKRAHR